MSSSFSKLRSQAIFFALCFALELRSSFAHLVMCVIQRFPRGVVVRRSSLFTRYSTARRCVHCVLVRIQLPAHQCMDATTHICEQTQPVFQSHIVVTQQLSVRMEPSPRSASSLVKWPSNVTHTPNALKASSSSGRSVRHGDACCQTVLCRRAQDSLAASITPVDLFTGCFQQFVVGCCHGEISMIQQLSAKSNRPR